jgi:L-ascorbate metabolism protein UlaG (beta-lactamase superfamily)
MIRPRLQDDDFLQDVATARLERDALHVWWLGQSGFLLQWHGQHLLFDPYLSDALTRKYRLTERPHVRMTERVIQPGRLNFIRVVTSSHNHTDHLDAETLLPLMQANPDMDLVIPEANREFVADRLKVMMEWPRGLDAGQRLRAGPFTIHAVPAAHEQVERDDSGRCRFLGYVVTFGEWCVFHSGDTVYYDGMLNWLERWRIDVAFLPINGRAPERGVAGNLWGREAAQLAHEAAVRWAVPCHYNMFEFNTASPDEFVAECGRLNQGYRVLEAGERWTPAPGPA